ncbi:MBL fold metallo-hydrolase [Natronosporangium hydrolyticum]|uniref:MBL fold metallo-hydrolase n=1 Tax=Natronosporangium hydrolyticum TaxID=2811111 RepID=A0A895YJF5_9ACTN|nr:MBL fold metallo-hydrolase [Natronosporangium hydrolyticum]QSB15493.1 MBL fold metallo-hydrolase [Natronosporangium hydrolyticum]
MQLTKYTHSCIRLEHDSGVLVIDPGGFSEQAALLGADVVLITHEHADHLDVDKLTAAAADRPSLTVYAHPDVVSKLAVLGEAVQVHPVNAGDEFTAAGFGIRVGGGQHALIHADIPRIANIGFLIEDVLYHPGDSVDPADLPAGSQVETLLLPINAPWQRLAEAVDFVRAVAPRQAYGIHDHLLSAAGAKVYDTNLSKLANCDYHHVEPATTIDLAGG